MSSETTKPAGPVGWDLLAIGVAIVTIRLSTAAAIGLSLAVLMPAYGLAEEPEVMRDVETQVKMAEEAAPDEEKTGLLKMGWEKAKAGGGALWDKALKIDEREERLMEDNERLRKELVQLKAEAAEARYSAGVQHEMMLQCGTDLLEYLKALPTD